MPSRVAAQTAQRTASVERLRALSLRSARPASAEASAGNLDSARNAQHKSPALMVSSDWGLCEDLDPQAELACPVRKGCAVSWHD